MITSFSYSCKDCGTKITFPAANEQDWQTLSSLTDPITCPCCSKKLFIGELIEPIISYNKNFRSIQEIMGKVDMEFEEIKLTDKAEPTYQLGWA